MKEKFQAFLPRDIRFPVAMVLFWTSLTYWVSKPLLTGRELFYLETALDEHIPLVPWTAVIYFLAFFFWAFSFIAVARRRGRAGEKMLAADCLAKLISLVVFVAFPCTNHRPALVGNDVFVWIMRFLYWVDQPTNIFPSIHCMESVLCWLAIREEKDIAPVWRVLSFLAAAAVCISTLTTKQHVIPDVLTGIPLAFVSYWIAGRTGLASWYQRTLDRLWRRKNN